MHPLIAFLAFLFAPSDDWMMKQAFDLMIDPSRLPAVVETYADLCRHYPSFAETGSVIVSADAAGMALWAEVLSAHGQQQEALMWWSKLEQDKRLPPEMRDDVRLRLGEAALGTGNRKEARQWLTKVAQSEGSPRAADAEVDLLVCDLADNNTAGAAKRAEQLKKNFSSDALPRRAYFPLGLAAYADNHFDEAARLLAEAGEDPKSQYFLGLALRHLNRMHEALVVWENLQRYGIDTSWRDRAELQLAETFFSIGDDALCRNVCERALVNDPSGPHHERFAFRLAALDMRQKNYTQALARLTPLLENKELGQRVAELTAESLAKTGHARDLYKALASRREGQPKSAESIYQTAWAAFADHRTEEALSRSETGLKDFLDDDFTPRLLLLQGLAYEHLGKEAEALATYQTVADHFPHSTAAAKSAHWLALAYVRNDRLSEAVTHVAYVWNKIPDETKRDAPDTEFWLGEAHLRLKRFDDADKHFQSFLALAPQDHPLRSYGYFERTVALAQDKRTDEALALLDQFRQNAQDKKIDSWTALAFLQRGNILFNQKQYAAAVVAYRQAGDQPKAMYHAGVALARLDYNADAVQTWLALADKFPNDAYGEKGLFRAARTQFELGLTTSSVASFGQFAERYPDSPLAKSARLQAAHALYNAGQLALAAPLYEDYLRRYRSSEDLAGATPYLASCYAHLGKSETEMADALKGLPPTDALASVRWTTGASHYNAHQYAEAEQSFTHLAMETPAHEQLPTALFYRAESLYQEKKWDEAEEGFHSFLRMSEKIDPDQAALALFHQGMSLFNQDKLLKAAVAFRVLVDSYPASNLAVDARQNLYLCYHTLGDWPTEQALRQRYGPGVATKTSAVVAQATSSVLTSSPTETSAVSSSSERSVAEVPSELHNPSDQPKTEELLGDASAFISPPQ